MSEKITYLDEKPKGKTGSAGRKPSEKWVKWAEQISTLEPRKWALFPTLQDNEEGVKLARQLSAKPAPIRALPGIVKVSVTNVKTEKRGEKTVEVGGTVAIMYVPDEDAPKKAPAKRTSTRKPVATKPAAKK